MAVGGDDNAEDVVAQGGNVQVCGSGFDVNSVVKKMSSGDRRLGDERDGQNEER